MTADLEERLRAADPLREAAPSMEADAGWLRAQTAELSARVGTRQRHDFRRLVIAAAVSMAALATAAGLAAALDGTEDDRPNAEESATRVELALGPDTPTMTSCVPFSIDILAEMPVAFSGTVVDVADTEVLVRVDRWYRGGDADEVLLTVPPSGTTTLDGGIDFRESGRYLLTAAQGVVNYCGFSAAWTQDMEETYTSAFSGR